MMLKSTNFKAVFVALAVFMALGLVFAATTPTLAAFAPHGTCAGLKSEIAGCGTNSTCINDEIAHYYACHNIHTPWTTCGNQYFIDVDACLGIGNCNDGRVNTNCSAPTIVYCDGDTVNFFKLVNNQGVLNFTVPMSSLLKSVSVKTLIKQVGSVKVYLMPDGRVLVVAPQSDGKDYYMFWDPSTCTSIQEGAEWNVQ